MPKQVPVPSIIQLLEQFPDEQAAREYFEEARWGGKPQCPDCGSLGKHIKSRPGVLRCTDAKCRRQFTVRVGTIMEATKIGYRKWLLAMHTFHVSRKGISSLQLAKEIGVTQKTAWFMGHRIREAMAQGGDAMLGGIVQVDETYLGGNPANRPAHKRKGKGKQGVTTKQAVIGAKEVGGKMVTQPLPKVNAVTAQQFIVDNVQVGATLHTDENRVYGGLLGVFYDHHTVNHSKGEYVRQGVTTNEMEGAWTLLKRAYHGIHHHWAAKHTHRYAGEMAFRVGVARVELPGMERLRFLFKGGVGKRLKYKGLVA